MNTRFFALLTRLGADKLANAAALGTRIEITHMAVGDGGGKLPTPDTAQTKLVNERRRAAINVLSIDPKNTNQIIAEQVIPESAGGWWIREIGLFDKDGILIAVGNCAETYKPQLQEGSGRTQTIRMVLIVSSTDAVTLRVDPAVVLATREYADSVVATALREHENSRRHPDATLKEKGFVILSNAVDSHSETQAATPKAVKAAYDLAKAADNNANGRVPAGRKVNGKALSADISLSAGDVGAYAKGETDARVNAATALANTANQNAANANNNANTRLEKSKNGADIPNKNEFVKNLGLADSVYRTIGNGRNQIPDMSFFGSSSNSFRLPTGHMMVFGKFSASVPMSANGGVASSEWVEFPVPFSRSCDCVTGVFAFGVGNGPIFYTCEMAGSRGFTLRAGTMSNSTGVVKLVFMYLAVGKY
ncbi:phage tail protein [Xenorhabdus kozodoii]|uniref:Phage tail protein n=1 Tax=Xenorhabdus kozodoii TaxID=351676 RepID=A0A2D0LDE2_9GAMM|nr:phage tail protein [Xenorhabdus kozodoii]PHM73718.1 phage tail protein [Xenorhabdus kozodoii]